MNEKHELIKDRDLFYCFASIEKKTNIFKFYIVPSKIVAKYVREEHQHWLDEKKKENKGAKDSAMRIFRIGLKGEKYAVSTPTAEQYGDNWEFKQI